MLLLVVPLQLLPLLLPVAAVCLIEFQVKCNDSTPPSMKDQDSTRCHDEPREREREREKRRRAEH